MCCTSGPGTGEAATRGATVGPMAADTRPQVVVSEQPGDLVVDLVAALRPRLRDLPEESLRRQVTAALDELGDVRVRTYLPIIVERMVRVRLALPAHEEGLRLPA